MEQNQQSGLYTIGRARTEHMHSIQSLIGSDDINNFQHLSVENDGYYDSLDDDSEPKNDLKTKWDRLSHWKNLQLQKWKEAYDAADNMDKHDLIIQKKQLLWLYEKERGVQVINNCRYYKTYWEM